MRGRAVVAHVAHNHVGSISTPATKQKLNHMITAINARKLVDEFNQLSHLDKFMRDNENFIQEISEKITKLANLGVTEYPIKVRISRSDLNHEFLRNLTEYLISNGYKVGELSDPESKELEIVDVYLPISW